ncbi:hypothetical protein SAMN06269185_2958 [Natronoarchaeum philippinense]|uniref:Uncharacterized protein n=1 Tax=Natronoarchaeum philippinense TaxID=558529 RepID=A0A285P687_NATPI|nr:hypothetical protein [Natronoarchaeum philippinense]SNZ17269.1 hypothetical protein SAMN06269185_2958 [Natronoarchaeum philippinense]
MNSLVGVLGTGPVVAQSLPSDPAAQLLGVIAVAIVVVFAARLLLNLAWKLLLLAGTAAAVLFVASMAGAGVL